MTGARLKERVGHRVRATWEEALAGERNGGERRLFAEPWESMPQWPHIYTFRASAGW
jgi:hypothetical protein